MLVIWCVQILAAIIMINYEENHPLQLDCGLLPWQIPP